MVLKRGLTKLGGRSMERGFSGFITIFGFGEESFVQQKPLPSNNVSNQETKPNDVVITDCIDDQGKFNHDEQLSDDCPPLSQEEVAAMTFLNILPLDDDAIRLR